jgi:hypothetical protein
MSGSEPVWIAFGPRLKLLSNLPEVLNDPKPTCVSRDVNGSSAPNVSR